MPSPEECARLLNPAHDPPRSGTWGHRQRSSCLGWEDRADARLTRISELEAERDALRGAVEAMREEALQLATQSDKPLAKDPFLDGQRAAGRHVLAILAAARIEAEKPDA